MKRFLFLIIIPVSLLISGCDERTEYPVAYIFASHCNGCTGIEKKLEKAEKDFRKYNRDFSLDLNLYNVMISDQYDPAMELIDSLDIPASAKNLPLLVAGRKWFYGEEDILRAVEILEKGGLPGDG